MLEGTCCPRLSFKSTLTRNLVLPLSETQRCAVRHQRRAATNISIHVLMAERKRTLAGQSLIQQLLHSGLERQKGKKVRTTGRRATYVQPKRTCDKRKR